MKIFKLGIKPFLSSLKKFLTWLSLIFMIIGFGCLRVSLIHSFCFSPKGIVQFKCKGCCPVLLDCTFAVGQNLSVPCLCPWPISIIFMIGTQNKRGFTSHSLKIGIWGGGARKYFLEQKSSERGFFTLEKKCILNSQTRENGFKHDCLSVWSALLILVVLYSWRQDFMKDVECCSKSRGVLRIDF